MQHTSTKCPVFGSVRPNDRNSLPEKPEGMLFRTYEIFIPQILLFVDTGAFKEIKLVFIKPRR
jgi:hypothetical protein